MSDTTLTVGSLAPDFTLPDADGTPHTLSAERGHWVLVYFYPKDNTPGCTTQACDLRDDWSAFQKANCTVWGISTDSVASHARFRDTYTLPFPLLADTEKAVVKAYGVWAPKKFMGREFLGTLRTSFLIDPDGVIQRIYPGVKPATHATLVLADLATLQHP
jgi:peroxiredoxin Q/BCP